MISQKNKLFISIPAFILFVVELFLIFFKLEFGHGDIIIWVIAILVSALITTVLALELHNQWSKKEYGMFVGLLILWWLNLITILFSIFDIAQIANHEASTIMFMVVPVVSLPIALIIK